MSEVQSIRVDIVSDVVCPWCVVGYRQLDKAATELGGVELDVHWHPFELNPQMAEQGENLREHIAAKYGSSDEESRQARERLTALGAELGFTFDYADDMRMYNTFRAHQLLDWARQQGLEHQTKQALFSAFFTRRQNVDDIQVLADVAASVGLDREAAVAVLESGERGDFVREQEQFWTSRGISGVPGMIFREKYLVSGAHGVENYRRILEQLQSESTASA